MPGQHRAPRGLFHLPGASGAPSPNVEPVEPTAEVIDLTDPQIDLREAEIEVDAAVGPEEVLGTDPADALRAILPDGAGLVARRLALESAFAEGRIDAVLYEHGKALL